MQTEPQDIYTSKEKREAGEPARQDSAYRWIRESESRWSAWGPFVILLFLVALLSAVVYLQHQRLERLRAESRLDLSGKGSLYALPLPPLAVDEKGRIVLDELSDVPFDRLPAGGVTNLTADWVIQAAVRLRHAARAVELGDWAAALLAYEETRRILPAVERLEESIGLCRLRLRQYGPAEGVFAALASTRSESAGVLNNLGVSLMGQDKNEPAEQAFRAAIAADPAYLPARQNLGLLLHRAGDENRAAEFLADAIRSGADSHEIRLMYASALLEKAQWKEAASVLEGVAGATPTAPVYFHLASARLNLGDRPGAIAALRKGVGLVDARAAARWIGRPEFDRLRDDPEFAQMAAGLAPKAPAPAAPPDAANESGG